MTTKTEIKQAILSRARERGITKSTCPSEIARLLFPGHWRSHMEAVRNAAVELQQSGHILITQRGIPIDTDHIKGPIRIKIMAQYD